MLRHQHGQAAAEFVALLPCLLAVLLVVWQLVLAGHARWAVAVAARAAARAEAVGADPARAARRRLPARLEHGLRVRVNKAGVVAVSFPVPQVVGQLSLGRVEARARFERQAP